VGSSNKVGKGKEQYAPMAYAILKSAAWRSLSGAAVKVYFELHARFHGGNNGRVTLSMNEAAKALGVGKATVQRGFDDLQAKGFIVLERKGNWYQHRAHEWRLTTKPVISKYKRDPATNEWRDWKPSEKTELGSETDPQPNSVVPFQNPVPTAGSDLEPVRAISKNSMGSESEH
jgi:DNA-binding transcriptional MocR family regulator